MCECCDNCVSVLVICVLVFTVFCIVCTVSLYCLVYVYLFLFVLSVLVYGLLPWGENSIATTTTITTTTIIIITAKVRNSWHMVNCKKVFDLQIRPPSLILLITISQDK